MKEHKHKWATTNGVFFKCSCGASRCVLTGHSYNRNKGIIEGFHNETIRLPDGTEELNVRDTWDVGL